jgi:hypothetical protein
LLFSLGEIFEEPLYCVIYLNTFAAFEEREDYRLLAGFLLEGDFRMLLIMIFVHVTGTTFMEHIHQAPSLNIVRCTLYTDCS